jgi:hypothetical protein
VGALLDVTRAEELVDDVEGDHDQNGVHPGAMINRGDDG